MLALALIVIPVVIRTTENMLSLIPNALREAAYALGTPKWRSITTVTLKAARAGVITGVLLAFARIAGETAPLLFTALSNQFWTSDLSQPMASLPVTIFKFAMSPYENWQKLAWAGVFLITLGVLLLNILARVLLPQPALTETTAWTPKSTCPRREKPKLSVRDLNFYYGELPRAEEHQPRHPREARSRPSSALRAAASRRCCAPSTACSSSTPSSAPKARSCSTARTS